MNTKNQRVLLTSQLAESYGTSNDVITKNFNRNKERYVNGKHFYLLQGDELKQLKAKGQIDLLPNANKLYLWTERGTFLHAKSLNTDKAWEVYDSLVEHYFQSREAKSNQLPSNYKEALLRLVAEIEEKEKLQLSNKMKDQQISELKPKAEYFDELVDRNLLTNFRDTSKELGIRQNDFVNKLLEDKYIYRDQKGKLRPYSQHVEKGLFQIKEVVSISNDNAYIQTLITPKGRETFRLLYSKKDK